MHIGSSELDTRGTAQLPLNTWSHLAATYDGANLRLYVNGTLVATRPTTGALAVGSGPLRIGGNSFAADEFFTGLIDEVRVYQPRAHRRRDPGGHGQPDRLEPTRARRPHRPA